MTNFFNSGLRPVVILVLFGVLLTSQTTNAETSFRIATYNIRGDFSHAKIVDKKNAWRHTSGSHRRDMVLKTIKSLDADLLALQEPYQNQLEDIRQLLPGYDSYAVGRKDGKSAGEHCAIFWRRSHFKPTAGGTFWLSETPQKAGSIHPDASNIRIASWVVLQPISEEKPTGKPFLFLNAHWDHISQPARLFAAKLIRKRLETTLPKLPRIVVGDFNTVEGSPELNTLLYGNEEGKPSDDQTASDTLQLHDTYRDIHPLIKGKAKLSYHNFKGGEFGRRIDHILPDQHFKATQAKIVRGNKEPPYPSDHYPVVVELTLD